jgi:hypothetical protein
VSPRAKGRLVGIAVLASLVGFLAYSIASAPPPDLMKVATEFLQQQDRGTVFESVAAPGTGLALRWGATSIEQATHKRVQTFGRFVRVVSAQPPEEVREGPDVLRRVRARIAFEKQEADAVFTFRRSGRWRLHDFYVPVTDPKSLGRADEVLRRAAMEALDQYGRHRFDAIWRTFSRPVRIGGNVELWQTEQAARIEAKGLFQRVEQVSWSSEQARGVLTARLVFEQGTLDARVVAVFEPTEARVVFEALDVGP